MTKQQIFDKVANHLVTQKRQAMNDDKTNCMYLDKDGYKCAIGCLLSEKTYAKILANEAEEYPIDEVCDLGLLSKNMARNIDFLLELQYVHDDVSSELGEANLVRTWAENLDKVAEFHKLKFDINEFKTKWSK